MTPETKQKIQVSLVLMIAVVAIRTAYIFYERWDSQREPAKVQAPPLDADYYVVPKKLHPYDLKSARQLTQQPVWVKEGYSYTYYLFDLARHRADFSYKAGLLLPIQKLQVKDVVTDISPDSPDQRQVIAVFQQEGKSYAFPIGYLKDGNYQFYSDDMLFLQDPHELYKHWPPEIWNAIDKHEVKQGMNELQADFALGIGISDTKGTLGNRAVNYPNGGKPISITFRNDKAVEIRSGT